MSYKWKPSASQRREFAERMQDPREQAAYEQRKKNKADKRRSGSKFDYHSAGGNYVPTREQYNFCSRNIHLFGSQEQLNAANMVMFGYLCNDAVDHDNIHIVNEIRRANPNL